MPTAVSAQYTLFRYRDIKKLLTKVKTHNVRAVGFSFIWGLAEDYSLSDSSEELLGRAGGEVCIHVILAKKYVLK